MISLQQVSLRRGTQLLLDGADLIVHGGQKVGVIGRNGSGKTSLFKLLMGELSLDGGELDMPAGLRKSQMLQETEGSKRSALEYVVDGDREFRRVEAALSAAEAREDHRAMAALHAELELMDGYTVHNRAQQLLSGLGFETGDDGRAVNDFSGGWRIRLNLAQALMTPSDLLLLDEPTNHLDLEATLWLQQWLQRYQGTLMLISHDRSFLDEVVSHVVSFEAGKLILYKGNYSAFERQKAERLAQQQAVYEKQQQRKKEIESFVRRFRAKASKARQAQSRLKALDRMAAIAPAHVDSPFQFEFFPPQKLPDTLLTCDKLTLGYGRPLVKDFSINIRPDTRIGLLGANGQGKSTLLKTLAGQLPSLGGDIIRSDHLCLGYSAQHQIDVLDASASPMQLMQRMDPAAREQEIRNFLGRFDFQGDRIYETIGHFSGGEKSRLGLAMVVWKRPNLLLMDEPTNHLDLDMCHALTVALQEFQGALILVSHDRHLLSNTVDQFLLVRDGRATWFEGDLEDYEQLLLQGQRQAVQADSAADLDRVDKRGQRQRNAARREELKPLTDRIKKLEKDLEKLHQRQRQIETSLAEADIYEEGRKQDLSALLLEQGVLNAKVEAAEGAWLEAQEQLESLTPL